MSKISLIMALFFAIPAGAEVRTTLGVVQRENDRFFIVAKDKEGFARRYEVSNAQEFIYDCARHEDQQTSIKGNFADKDVLNGSVKLHHIGEAVLDPLGIATITAP